MRLVAIAVLVLAVTACGSSSSPVYARQPSAACLRSAGVHIAPVSDLADFVAASATGGAFGATLAKNSVTVSFGETDVDADNIEQAYRRFHAKNVGIDDILRRQGNAVMLWRTHPEDPDLATITGCLKS